jgi:hypothetical protein
VWRWVSTTSVSIFVCGLGAAALFLPWAEATVILFDPAKPPRPDGALEVRQFYTESYPGYRFWHAGAAAGGFLAVLVLLVAAGGLAPAPLWRSAAQLAICAAVIGVVIAGMNYRHTMAEGDQEAGRAVQLSWGPVNIAVIGLAVAVMLLAAVELRGRIAGRRQGQISAEQSAVADPARDSASGGS